MSKQGYLIFIGAVVAVFSLGLWLNNYLGKTARAGEVTYHIDEEKFLSFLKNDTTTFAQQSTFVINAWATWCKPCLEEIPELNRLRAKYQQEEFAFIAPTQETKKKVDEFIFKRNDSSDTTRLDAKVGSTESETGVVQIKLNHNEELGKEGDFYFDYALLYEQEDFIPYLFSINPGDDIRVPISESDARQRMMYTGIPLNVIIHKGEILFYEIGYDEENIKKMDVILAGLAGK